ncbi:RodZ domain-containing protein [uncultured Lactobacillus sp.]|uniref:helix-turn-helix domain-containing protein n=1 Tax=uncultured Lactobacillus sp. TaxID=153152 RepID=UPI0026367683|nr:RodZ domain-containing protein [uncultured Lactobacillus sp.]
MADIGDKLRSARKAKGMSIEDVEKITKIQRRYLTALENNDFDQLPGDFYVRAFIKQYAQVVGLNGNELLNDFHSEVPESKPEEYVENSIDNKSEEIRRTTRNKKGLWKAYLPKAAAVIGVFLVIFVVYLVYAHFFAPGSNQQSANQADNVTVSSSSESSSSKKKKALRKTKTSKVRIEKLGENRYRVLDFKKASDRDLKLETGATSTWAQVTVDGQVRWSGTLQANSEHRITLSRDVKNVHVNFGNSVSTKLTLAGKKVQVHNANNPNVPLSVSFVFGALKQTSTTNNPTVNTNTQTNNYSANTTNSANTNSQVNTQSSQNRTSQTQSTQRPVQSQTQNTQTNTNQNSAANNQASSNQTQSTNTQSSANSGAQNNGGQSR